MIKKVRDKDNFKSLAKLLNDSFITVIDDFGITKDNCPSHRQMNMVSVVTSHSKKEKDRVIAKYLSYRHILII